MVSLKLEPLTSEGLFARRIQVPEFLVQQIENP